MSKSHKYLLPILNSNDSRLETLILHKVHGDFNVRDVMYNMPKTLRVGR